ncbi:VENN motif pre-toxin domain-containing protein, partial [Moraxella sp. Tifton1]|nr:VENN motif pre-toxin domain-containing protein [Moraxella sp. Tifton1]
MGATIGEMWADHQTDDPNTLTQTQKDTLIHQAKLLAAITAAYADEDVGTAASMAEEAVRWNGTRRASVRNPIQQQRRDLIALETIAIRKHLPNFHGLQYIRSNGQITQEEVLEYQAFSRFIRFSNQTYANTNIAYQAFRQVNNRVYL